jgi:hypothetical protein
LTPALAIAYGSFNFALARISPREWQLSTSGDS